jgi:hypothetical protein
VEYATSASFVVESLLLPHPAIASAAMTAMTELTMPSGVLEISLCS